MIEFFARQSHRSVREGNPKMSRKILMIDDEPDVSYLVARRIRSWGDEVVCLPRWEGALEAIRKENPKLILLDIRLPDAIGTDVYRTIREDQTLPRIPIVFFSAHDSEEKHCVEELGADGFIRKPYDPQELKRLIEALVPNEPSS